MGGIAVGVFMKILLQDKGTTLFLESAPLSVIYIGVAPWGSRSLELFANESVNHQSPHVIRVEDEKLVRTNLLH